MDRQVRRRWRPASAVAGHPDRQENEADHLPASNGRWRGGDRSAGERQHGAPGAPLSVNLATTPILCWRWLVDAPVARGDMTRKSGDDYAARLYVAFDMPASAMSAGTRLKLGIARRLFGGYVPDAALNYVWDNRNPVGTRRNSAYTDRALLIVAETGTGHAGTWVTERVDIAVDFASAFGNRQGTPIQIAIASDTDNTGSIARAAFADLRFVTRRESC